MNNVFAIGIPTLNRADLLNPVLKKYAADFPDTKIYVVDNGNQDIDFFSSLAPMGRFTKIPMIKNRSPSFVNFANILGLRSCLSVWMV